MHYKKENKIALITLIICLGLTAGCGMNDVINDEINKKDKLNSSQNIDTDDLAITKEDAAKMLQQQDMESAKELDLNVPENKEYFDNAEELAQYISYMFFSFYHNDIDAATYLSTLYQHAHSDYLSYFSKDKKNAIEYLQDTKKKYLKSLSSPLKSYVITELQYENNKTIATFYYKTILKDDSEIYTLTTLKKEKGKWKLYDNRPSTPYSVENK